VIDRIRELAANHSDQQIAEVLNMEEMRSRFGKLYNAGNINRLRRRFKIQTNCPDTSKYLSEGCRGDGRCTTTHVARLLGLDPSTVGSWCDQGRLDAVRNHPLGARWIKIKPDQIPELQKTKGQRRAKSSVDRKPLKAG
jgi:hypothetical protein